MSAQITSKTSTFSNTVKQTFYGKLIILYILLVFGGIWHIFQVLQFLTTFLAAPLIIGLGLWLFLENQQLIKVGDDEQPNGLTIRQKFIMWSILVLFSGIFIEWAGVKTGLIFGEYIYGTNLPPYIGSVPVAIGFAWLGMLLASVTLGQKLFPHFFRGNSLQSAFLAATFMTLFDAFMEPAAIRLGYWTWHSGVIPLQNYGAWFLVSFSLTWIGFRMGLFQRKLSPLGIHAYAAQLIYFILVYFS
jgi:hypothetical protein